MIRLDAVGYAIKKPGTSCFMIPETFRFIARADRAGARAWAWKCSSRFTVTTWQQMEIARQVDWVYDFALPPLILHTLFTRNAQALGHWLRHSPAELRSPCSTRTTASE